MNKAILLPLLFALFSHGAASSETEKDPLRKEWKQWYAKEVHEMKDEPYSLFSLMDRVVLNPNERAYLSLEKTGKSKPRWLKAPPKGAHAEFFFDGKNLTRKTGTEEPVGFLSGKWDTPNGLALQASSAKRGFVWIYLHAPKLNMYREKLMPWFPFDPNAVVTAVVDRSQKDDHPVVKTTQGDTRNYKVIGVAKFELNGESQTLQLFETDSEKPLNMFITFKDKTNGKLTYGGGRYVEAKLAAADSNELVIDFNRAYNPYCAWTHHYNCPLITGNTLSVALEAGGKIPPHRLD